MLIFKLSLLLAACHTLYVFLRYTNSDKTNFIAKMTMLFSNFLLALVPSAALILAIQYGSRWFLENRKQEIYIKNETSDTIIWETPGDVNFISRIGPQEKSFLTQSNSKGIFGCWTCNCPINILKIYKEKDGKAFRKDWTSDAVWEISKENGLKKCVLVLKESGFND